MSYLVEKYLSHLVLLSALRQVLRDRNTFAAMIALSEASGGSVKTERPVPGKMMDREKAGCFGFNPGKLCHVDRLAGA